MKTQMNRRVGNQDQTKLNLSIASLISIGLIVSLTIGVSSGNAQAPPLRSYQVTDLGVLPAKKARASIPAAINNQGQVAGTSGMSAVDESAFLYDSKSNKGVLEDLARNYGGISHGFAINEVGDVVGDSNMGTAESTHAALFKNGKIVDLGTLKGTLSSQANGINASGLVVGSCVGKPEDNTVTRAFFWNAGAGMIDIGTLGGARAQAFGINNSGMITGTAEVGESSRFPLTHAFIYNPFSMSMKKNMIDLGTLGGSESVGMAINANNHVVGYSTLDRSSDFRVHAFLYDGRKMRDLGALETWIGADQSYALGVNLLDQVVGYAFVLATSGTANPDPPTKQAAFVYIQGQMLNLNDLIGDATKTYWLKSATGINDNGQIIAIAYDLDTTELHAVMLTPW